MEHVHPRAGHQLLVVLAYLAVALAVAGCNGDAAAPPEATPALSVAPADGAAEVQLPTVEAAPAEPATVAPAPTGGRITGKVTDPEGEAIRDAIVVVRSDTVPLPEMGVYTDAQGAYVWTVSAGEFTVETYRDGYSSAQAEVSVGVGEEVVQDFTLEPN